MVSSWCFLRAPVQSSRSGSLWFAWATLFGFAILSRREDQHDLFDECLCESKRKSGTVLFLHVFFQWYGLLEILLRGWLLNVSFCFLVVFFLNGAFRFGSSTTAERGGNLLAKSKLFAKVAYLSSIKNSDRNKPGTTVHSPSHSKTMFDCTVVLNNLATSFEMIVC